MQQANERDDADEANEASEASDRPYVAARGEPARRGQPISKDEPKMTMTPERFGEIVGAYGADPRRWPAAERASAERWAALHRREARALLAEAASLDACLSSDTVAPPERALYRGVLTSANLRGARRFPRMRPRLLASGAAFAGMGLAGGAAGALAVSFFMLTGSAAPAAHVSAYLTTGFGAPAADWSGE